MPYTPYKKSGASGYVPFKGRKTTSSIGVAKDPDRIKKLQEEALVAKQESERLNRFSTIAKETAKESLYGVGNIVKDIVKGSAELAISAAEVNPRAIMPKKFEEFKRRQPEYNIPGLSKFIGPVKSFQTQAEESVKEGSSAAGAIGTGALQIAVNEPLGVAFKPAFLGLGLIAKEAKPIINALKLSNVPEEVNKILGRFFPKLTPKAIEEVSPKIAKVETTEEVQQLLEEAAQLSKTGGGIAGEAGLRKVGLANEPARELTTNEVALLKKKLRDEARGAQVGSRAAYQEARTSITNALRNKFDTKLATLKRGTELKELKTNIIARDALRVRNEITDFVKQNIPTNERGRFLSLVSNAKTQRDLVNAFTKIDARAEAIQLKSAIAGLKKSAEQLTSSPSVSVDYRNKVKDLISEYELSGHNKSTIAKLESTREYLNRMEASGEDVYMPKRILERLAILSRTPKEKLTLDTVERLQQEIDLLEQVGRAKLKTREFLYEAEKAKRTEELLKEGAAIESVKVPGVAVGDEPKVWSNRVIKARNYLLNSRVSLRPVDGLAEITGMTPMKRTLDIDFGAYLGRDIESVPLFRKLETEMLEAGQKLTKGQRERVGVYGVRRQEGGYEKLANSGITREEADAVELTAEEMDFYKKMQAFNEGTYDAVRKYMQETYNVDVGKVENYMSYQTDFEQMSDIEMYDRFGRRADEAVDYRTKNVPAGFTKARTGAGGQKIVIDALEVSKRHADDVAYMLTMGRDIKQYSEIVASEQMRKKLGDTGAAAWLQYLDLMARKGGSSNSARIAALDTLRTNLGAGVLGFRLSSALVQLTSFADSVATVGIDYASAGAKDIATSREWRDFIMNNFPEVRAAVGDDIAFRDFNSGLLGKAQEVGMKPLVMIDGMMRSSAAAGAYRRVAKEAGVAVDLTKPDKTLIAKATKLMRDSQGSSFFKDQPLALTTGMGVAGNKSVNKLIFTFQSFVLNRWENIERQIWRMGIKEGDYVKAGMSAFWMFVFASMAEEALRETSDTVLSAITGKEKKERDFVANAAGNVFQGIPLVGNMASSVMYSSNPIPVVNTFEDMLEGLKSAISGKKDETRLRGGVRVLGSLGSLAGVPGSSQLAQIIRDAIPEARGRSVSPF